MAKQLILHYHPSASIIHPGITYDAVEFVGGACIAYTETGDKRQHIFGGNIRSSLPAGETPWKVIVRPYNIAYTGSMVGTGSKKVGVLKWLEPGPTVTLDAYTRVDNFEQIGDWAILTLGVYLIAYHNNAINTINVEPTT